DGVSAPRGCELDPLDAVEVHADAADVAEKPRPIAISQNAEVLGGVVAAEVEGVEAGLAFDHVTAVAGVPDEPVVAVAQRRKIITGPARDDIVAGAADQRVVAVA